MFVRIKHSKNQVDHWMLDCLGFPIFIFFPSPEGTMAPSLKTLRDSALLPFLAVAVSLLLVAGQVFNCCRLNAVLSEKLAVALQGIGNWDQHPSEPVEAHPLLSHTGCHGHPAPGESQMSHAPLEGVPIQWKSAVTCLSELDAVPEAIQPTSNPPMGALFATTWVPAADWVPSLPHFENSRPQNKSSPPVYLRTRRILV